MSPDIYRQHQGLCRTLRDAAPVVFLCRRSLEIYGAVQMVLVDFVDEDALGIAPQEEEGDGAKPYLLGEELVFS